MKKQVLILCSFFCILFTGCSDDNESNSPIKVVDKAQSDNKFYADDTQASVQVVAEGDWATTITETTSVRTVASPDWISISPSSGSKGTYTINITLSMNDSGKDRSATINFVCNGERMEIKVEQKAIKENGEKPEEPSLEEKTHLISRIDAFGDVWTFFYDEQNRLSEVTYVEERMYSYKYNYSYPNDFTINCEVVETSNHKNGTSFNAVVQLKDGYIVSGSSKESWGSQTYTYSWSAEYDEQYYLKKTTWWTEEDSMNDKKEIFCSWIDGNMTGVDGYYTGEATYSEYENSKNINMDLNWVLYHDEAFWYVHGAYEYKIFGFMGLYGKRSQNLVAESKDNLYTAKTPYRYSYTFDEKGRVIKVEAKTDKYEEADIVVIEYKE